MTWKRFTDEQPPNSGWYWIRTDGYAGAWPHYVQVDADGAFIISGAGAFTPRMAAGLHWWPQRIEEPEGD